MAKFVECSFEGGTHVLDGNEFIDSAFKNCRLVVTRGNYSLQRCTFESCYFEFGGEAENIRNLVLSLVEQPRSNSSEADQDPVGTE